MVLTDAILNLPNPYRDVSSAAVPNSGLWDVSSISSAGMLQCHCYSCSRPTAKHKLCLSVMLTVTVTVIRLFSESSTVTPAHSDVWTPL